MPRERVNVTFFCPSLFVDAIYEAFLFQLDDQPFIDDILHLDAAGFEIEYPNFTALGRLVFALTPGPNPNSLQIELQGTSRRMSSRA